MAVQRAIAQRPQSHVRFLEEAEIDIALSRFLGNQVPQVAYFGLADAVDASEPLFNPVGVPGQIVVDHQVCPLQVDALPGSIGRNQKGDIFFLCEPLLDLAAVLPLDPPVDGDNSLRMP